MSADPEVLRGLADEIERGIDNWPTDGRFYLSFRKDAWRLILAALRAPQKDGAAAGEPPPGLLMSMALRYDHGIGAPIGIGGRKERARRLDATLTTMRQLWEEVAGHGFYRPEKEADYAAMADRIRAAPPPDLTTEAQNAARTLSGEGGRADE